MSTLEYVYVQYHCYSRNAVGWLPGPRYPEGRGGFISPFVSNLLDRSISPLSYFVSQPTHLSAHPWQGWWRSGCPFPPGGLSPSGWRVAWAETGGGRIPTGSPGSCVQNTLSGQLVLNYVPQSGGNSQRESMHFKDRRVGYKEAWPFTFSKIIMTSFLKIRQCEILFMLIFLTCSSVSCCYAKNFMDNRKNKNCRLRRFR